MTSDVTICILGASQVGKSSIVLQYVCNRFESDYTQTISDTFFAKESAGTQLYHLKIQDTSGHDDYADLLGPTIEQSDVFIFVYDVNDAKSLEKVEDLYSRVFHLKQHFVAIIVGTKKDIGERQVAEKTGLAFAKERSKLFMEVSAKNSGETHGIFRQLIELWDQKLMDILPEKKEGLLSFQSLESN